MARRSERQSPQGARVRPRRQSAPRRRDLDDRDLACARLACRAFRNHSSPAQKKLRKDFLRTHAHTCVVVFAWASMPGFAIIGGPSIMLRLAASVGCVDVLEELVDNRHCELGEGVCVSAAREGHLDALVWLRSRGCPWWPLLDGR
jgi:hypothetical protein